MWGNFCKWARDLLPLLAGEELIGPDRRRVERHLIGCTGCRDRLESLRLTLGVLRFAASESPTSPDTPSLWPSLARQLRESRRPVSPRWDWAVARPQILAWSTVGAAVALCVTLGVLGHRPGGRFEVAQRHPSVTRPTAPRITHRVQPAAASNPEPSIAEDPSPSRPEEYYRPAERREPTN